MNFIFYKFWLKLFNSEISFPSRCLTTVHIGPLSYIGPAFNVWGLTFFFFDARYNNIEDRTEGSGRSWICIGRTGRDGIPKPWIFHPISFSPPLSSPHVSSFYRTSPASTRRHHDVVVVRTQILKMYAGVYTRAAIYLPSTSKETRPSTARRTGFQKVEHPATCSLICSYVIIRRATYARVPARFYRKNGDGREDNFFMQSYI